MQIADFSLKIASDNGAFIPKKRGYVKCYRIILNTQYSILNTVY